MGDLNKMRKALISVATWAALWMAAGPVLAAGNAEAGQAKAAVCAGCHMPDGNSVNPEWPKLAGQISSYLVRQLKAFKSGDRVNQVMEPFMKPLSDQDIEDLAAYFASQKVTPGTADESKLAKGEKLYKKGVFYTPVTACIGCHGMKGGGNPAWEEILAAPSSVLAPALSGQHATYVANQLKAFRSGGRSNDTGKVMRNIAQRLSDEQIESVAQYITQLR